MRIFLPPTAAGTGAGAGAGAGTGAGAGAAGAGAGAGTFAGGKFTFARLDAGPPLLRMVLLLRLDGSTECIILLAFLLTPFRGLYLRTPFSLCSSVGISIYMC